MEQFTWTPGDGIDAAALARLRAHFPRPTATMGEAWFMGDERRMFYALLGNLDELTTQDLQQALAEIVSGTSAFGPRTEWREWYQYLLGQLLPRHHETSGAYLLESLVTGFMAIYPNGIHIPPYEGFRDDVLLTLGRCMMDSLCWNGADIAIGKVLRQSNDNPHHLWGWWNASGDFSASMFFCLKYLPESSVAPWLCSVLEIPSPHWRAQAIAWLVGAHGVLNGAVRWPAEFSTEACPSIDWAWSHCLNAGMAAEDDSGGASQPVFIPEANRTSALNAVHCYFSEDRYLEWLDGLSAFPYLAAELADIPSAFEKLYVRQACL